jgi:hypothetical protein
MRRAMAGLSDRGIIATVASGPCAACRGHSLVTMQSKLAAPPPNLVQQSAAHI